ncbi:tyrosinase family oxidase copper chaperone [Streptomyces ficellus]|uniref:Tyrosinase co-factor protein n=1 Tax=Streptomyces ficellus TaxID=1977088 RepID=A0A6I6FKF9_9ACTN|nr:tyrosinase family oxidase copper chaperone [Streptomyces ficellus]QGV79329.1 tyrosinase co-factor protein [Streptomyces ficellus]
MSVTQSLTRLLPRRRTALRALFTLTVTAFTGGTLAHVATTRPDGPATRRAAGAGAEAAEAAKATPRAGGGGEGAPFDEMYRGRHIRGGPAAEAAGFEVRIDGRPLHLMRRAGGGYLTPVDHYQSYPTPLAAARAAVDELGTARLALGGGHHGVRP